MTGLSFAELQQKMQLEKKEAQDVKYKFRTAEDIFSAFKRLKTDWIIYVYDKLVPCEGRIFVEATAIAKRGDESFRSVAYAELSPVPVLNTKRGTFKQMQEPQWSGAVSSYARKYALQGLLAIGEEDVDSYPVNEDQVQLIDADQYSELVSWTQTLARTVGQEYDAVESAILGHFNIKSYHDVPIEHFETVKGLIQSKNEKNKQKFENI
ncbi:TPA: ERF family protein [Streptococcus suis]|nr:ERF family protein [Streptococcus suis]